MFANTKASGPLGRRKPRDRRKNVPTFFKASLTISMMALGLVAGSWAAGASAEPPPAPPGQGPCSHGNTGKECKPDPSVNGKDCDLHGNNGGVNEDHCLAATTPVDVVVSTNVTTTTSTIDTSTTTPATTATNGGTATGATNAPAANGSAPTSAVLGAPAEENGTTPGQAGAGVLRPTVSAAELAFTP